MDIVILHRDGEQLTVDRASKEVYQNCLKHGWELKYKSFQVQYEINKDGQRCGVKSIKVLQQKSEPIKAVTKEAAQETPQPTEQKQLRKPTRLQKGV